jgi:hypothetical protein
LSVQCLEGLAYLWSVGDFFHRFTVVNRHYGTLLSVGQWGLNTSWDTIPFSIFAPLLWWRDGSWGKMNQDQSSHGLAFCLAVGGLVLGVLALGFGRAPVSGRAKAGFALGAFWVVWPLMYHQFGSQSLTHFVPIKGSHATSWATVPVRYSQSSPRARSSPTLFRNGVSRPRAGQLLSPVEKVFVVADPTVGTRSN